MDVDGNGSVTSEEMRKVMSEMLPEHSDLYDQNSFHSAIDMPPGVSGGGGSKNPRICLNINLIIQSAKGGFFQKVRCVFQISKSPKKIFQISILNLKFKFPANNSIL